MATCKRGNKPTELSPYSAGSLGSTLGDSRVDCFGFMAHNFTVLVHHFSATEHLLFSNEKAPKTLGALPAQHQKANSAHI